MTAPTRDNVFIVGPLKDPAKPIPVLPQSEIDAAVERVRKLLGENMAYQGFLGSVEYSDEDGRFFGSVLGIRDSVSYHGADRAELERHFHSAVEQYLRIKSGVPPAESGE